MKNTLLTAHMKNVHGMRNVQNNNNALPTNGETEAISPDKLFTCRECGKTFKSHSYLKQHMLTVHVSDGTGILIQGSGWKSGVIPIF